MYRAGESVRNRLTHETYEIWYADTISYLGVRWDGSCVRFYHTDVELIPPDPKSDSAG